MNETKGGNATVMKMDYQLCYQRNIGIFNQDQQNLLKNAKVVVAGVGGVGGIEAATLAQMGIGELVIFDPGVFDEPDMNLMINCPWGLENGQE